MSMAARDTQSLTGFCVRLSCGTFMGRALRILLILTQALWLNVMLPGHTRGSITLSGSKHSSCCASKNNDSGSKDRAPSQRDREHCAICYFAAGLVSPPVVDFRL